MINFIKIDNKVLDMSDENILVFCAHSDDHILGPGGTLAKYAKEGKKVYTYIFSYGETSHIHMKREVIIKIRVSEAKKADEEIGGAGVCFFGLSEGKFDEDAERLHIKKRIGEIIREKNPTKIFTHNADDPHIDHRSTNKIVLDEFDEMKCHADVYAFDIWSPLTLAYRRNPQLIVDIKKTFNLKLKSFSHFKSQKLTSLTLLWSVYAKAIKNGFLHGYRFAEVFYKIR